jgi:hypothetical protein
VSSNSSSDGTRASFYGACRRGARDLDGEEPLGDRFEELRGRIIAIWKKANEADGGSLRLPQEYLLSVVRLRVVPDEMAAGAEPLRAVGAIAERGPAAGSSRELVVYAAG